jgi:DNA (cytosine-5)-methyltransferase 1
VVRHGLSLRCSAGVFVTGIVLDLFAGPGGWDEGVRPLGIHPVGIEWDHDACLTATKAGHTRVQADVELLPTEPMRGRVEGLIMSPPCQDFSLAGKRAGVEGEKGRLITQVLRWTHELMPTWVACEQVPPCLDYWHAYGQIMREWGYRTWVGILNSADYGVPQTRKRAILLASLDRQPCRPEPTHARGGDVDLFGERQPWISMADALGWEGEIAYRRTRGPGMTERYGERRDHDVDEPAPTLTGKARSDEWIIRTNQVSDSSLSEGYYSREASRPSPTLTGVVRSWRWERDPATTIVAGHNRSSSELPNGSGADSVRVSVEEAAILQTFPPDYPWQGSRTSQFQQVGNAIPPRLALHTVAEVLGLAVPDVTVVAA